jgi:hypothetical protein
MAFGRYGRDKDSAPLLTAPAHGHVAVGSRSVERGLEPFSPVLVGKASRHEYVAPVALRHRHSLEESLAVSVGKENYCRLDAPGCWSHPLRRTTDHRAWLG